MVYCIVSWAAILQLQPGLKNLNVLEVLQNCPDMNNFFCYKPPNLTTGKFANILVLLLHWSIYYYQQFLSDIFQPTFNTYSSIVRLASSRLKIIIWHSPSYYSIMSSILQLLDFLEECGSCNWSFYFDTLLHCDFFDFLTNFSFISWQHWKKS